MSHLEKRVGRPRLPESEYPAAMAEAAFITPSFPSRLSDGPSPEGEVASDVTDAEVSIARLDARAVALTDTEALARLLLRAESVASAHIEGLSIPRNAF